MSGEGSDGHTVSDMANASRSETVVETAEAGAVKVVEKQAQRRIFKIIVIGDSNVGKTCLTYRFCLGKFPDKTEATIGVDFREKSVQVGSEYLKVSCPLFALFVYTGQLGSRLLKYVLLLVPER